MTTPCYSFLFFKEWTFFKIFIYLFVCAWSPLWHVGFFFFSVAACRTFSCSVQTLSCSMWDLVHLPGIKPGPPTFGAWSPSHWTTREVPIICFFFFYSHRLNWSFHGHWKLTTEETRLEMIYVILNASILNTIGFNLSRKKIIHILEYTLKILAYLTHTSWQPLWT